MHSPSSAGRGFWSVCSGFFLWLLSSHSFLLLHHDLLQGLQEIPARAPGPPPFLPPLPSGLAGLFLTLFRSSLTAWQHFALSYTGFPQGVEGLCGALQWICLGFQHKKVCNVGLPLITNQRCLPQDMLQMPQLWEKLDHSCYLIRNWKIQSILLIFCQLISSSPDSSVASCVTGGTVREFPGWKVSGHPSSTTDILGTAAVSLTSDRTNQFSDTAVIKDHCICTVSGH